MHHAVSGFKGGSAALITLDCKSNHQQVKFKTLTGLERCNPYRNAKSFHICFSVPLHFKFS